MKVFTYYDTSGSAPKDQDLLVTLWERGWKNRGWTPRLISERHAKRSRFYKDHKEDRRLHPLMALQRSGGGLLVPMYVMNFGLSPKQVLVSPSVVIRQPFEIVSGSAKALRDLLEGKSAPHNFQSGPCARYETALWMEAPLVFFSDPNKILNCGRAL